MPRDRRAEDRDEYIIADQGRRIARLEKRPGGADLENTIQIRLGSDTTDPSVTPTVQSTWDVATANNYTNTTGLPPWLLSATSTLLTLDAGIYIVQYQARIDATTSGMVHVGACGRFEISGTSAATFGNIFDSFDVPIEAINSLWCRSYPTFVFAGYPAPLRAPSYYADCRYDGSSFASGDIVTISDNQGVFIVKIA